MMRPQHNYKSQTAFDSKRVRKRTLKSKHKKTENYKTFFISNPTGHEITTVQGNP